MILGEMSLAPLATIITAMLLGFLNFQPLRSGQVVALSIGFACAASFLFCLSFFRMRFAPCFAMSKRLFFVVCVVLHMVCMQFFRVVFSTFLGMRRPFVFISLIIRDILRFLSCFFFRCSVCAIPRHPCLMLRLIRFIHLFATVKALTTMAILRAFQNSKSIKWFLFMTYRALFVRRGIQGLPPIQAYAGLPGFR